MRGWASRRRAKRTSRLYVNDQYAGLYAVVESIDKSFLARVFGSIGDDTQNDGYLYEFNYIDRWTFNYLGSDLAAYKARFDPKTHESKSDAENYGPIENLVRLANELAADQFMPVLGEHLDLQRVHALRGRPELRRRRTTASSATPG